MKILASKAFLAHISDISIINKMRASQTTNTACFPQRYNVGVACNTTIVYTSGTHSQVSSRPVRVFYPLGRSPSWSLAGSKFQTQVEVGYCGIVKV